MRKGLLAATIAAAVVTSPFATAAAAAATSSAIPATAHADTTPTWTCQSGSASPAGPLSQFDNVVAHDCAGPGTSAAPGIIIFPGSTWFCGSVAANLAPAQVVGNHCQPAS